MSILVTRTPGSGKTTLTQYTRWIGDRRFFDADEIATLCEWREFDTGKILGYTTEQKATQTINARGAVLPNFCYIIYIPASLLKKGEPNRVTTGLSKLG